MGERGIFFMFLLIVMICGGCNGGKVYKVGGSSGWTNTNITPFRYKSWASSKAFHVGDTLLFEYNKEFHDVVRVTHYNFNTCNSTAAYSSWATGNDSFIISRPGHFYFICSLPGHCWAGQKIDIRVTTHNKPAHTPSPSPLGPSPPSLGQSPLSPGTFPVPLPPAHSPKSGYSSLPLPWKLWLLVAAIGVPAIAC